MGGTIFAFFTFFFAQVMTGLKLCMVLAAYSPFELCDKESTSLSLSSVSLKIERHGLSIRSFRELRGELLSSFRFDWLL